MANKNHLKGKTALVTGGAKRIGKAISLALAEAGVNVVIHHYQSVKQAKETALEVTHLGVKAWIIQANFFKQAQAEKLYLQPAS